MAQISLAQTAAAARRCCIDYRVAVTDCVHFCSYHLRTFAESGFFHDLQLHRQIQPHPDSLVGFLDSKGKECMEEDVHWEGNFFFGHTFDLVSGAQFTFAHLRMRKLDIDL